MHTLEDIQRAITHLSPEDLAAFRVWFAQFDAEAWDRQLAEDVLRGRLESLADEALRELRK